MKADYKQAAKTAGDYYGSADADADAFCAAIRGGKDIAGASARTVRHMVSELELAPGIRVIDFGAGYGGAARHLARETGAQVTCLTLSEKENARNRKLTAEQDVEDKIEVVHGLFADIPFPDDSFDVVWSQEALLHSGGRARVLKEVLRVLRRGGDFIFTDPMQADAGRPRFRHDRDQKPYPAAAQPSCPRARGAEGAASCAGGADGTSPPAVRPGPGAYRATRG